MWEKGKILAACMFAMAWWSVFYPELCFAEGSCEMVQTAETGKEDGHVTALQDGETDIVSGLLHAEDDEIVISSRLLEWCEERLSDRKE